MDYATGTKMVIKHDTCDSEQAEPLAWDEYDSSIDQAIQYIQSKYLFWNHLAHNAHFPWEDLFPVLGHRPIHT